MHNSTTQTGRRRRSRAEVAALAAGFEQSGLSRTEYCRQNGLSLATLNRHRRDARDRSDIRSGLVRHTAAAISLIPVDVVDSEPAHQNPHAALFIEFAGGRRIGVGAGFDAETLRRLIAVLEAA